MHGFFSAAQPYLIALIAVVAPALTLLYARRDKKSDSTKAAGQQFIDNIVKDNETLRISEERWRQRAEEAEAEILDRNKKLSQHGTNAPEMFDLMDVPGAMEMLRKRRDEYRKTAS